MEQPAAEVKPEGEHVPTEVKGDIQEDIRKCLEAMIVEQGLDKFSEMTPRDIRAIVSQTEEHNTFIKETARAMDEGEDEVAPAPSAPKSKPKVTPKSKKQVDDDDAPLAGSLVKGRKRRTVMPIKKPFPNLKNKKRAASGDDGDKKPEDEATIKRREAMRARNRERNLHTPSYALCDFLGVAYDTQLMRSDVTKMIWDYIKAKNLQQESDRRKIGCDEKLQALFKRKIPKALSQHLKRTADLA